MCIIANAMMKKMLCKIVCDPVYSLLVGTTIAIVASLLWTMLFTAADGGVFAQWLDAEGKNETIKLIGLGLGGALAAMGTVALNRRAAAMMQQNTLIERGHIDERFKTAVQSLGSEHPSSRIAAIYQFYYLAKGSPDKDFVKSIFDILCAHLRQIASKEEYRKDEEQHRLTEECQSLLDVLFRNSQHLFAGMPAQLARVHLVGANLRGADLQNADFSFAILNKAVFKRAKLQKAKFTKTKLVLSSFSGADVREAHFTLAVLQQASLSYAKNAHTAVGLDSAIVDGGTKPPKGYRIHENGRRLCKDASLSSSLSE